MCNVYEVPRIGKSNFEKHVHHIQSLFKYVQVCLLGWMPYMWGNTIWWPRIPESRNSYRNYLPHARYTVYHKENTYITKKDILNYFKHSTSCGLFCPFRWPSFLSMIELNCEQIVIPFGKFPSNWSVKKFELYDILDSPSIFHFSRRKKCKKKKCGTAKKVKFIFSGASV